jgi:hypothetical protein
MAKEIEVIAPSDLVDNMEEMYYRACVQHNTPDKVHALLFEITNMEKQYAKQEAYELAGICKDMYNVIQAKADTKHMVSVLYELQALVK